MRNMRQHRFPVRRLHAVLAALGLLAVGCTRVYGQGALQMADASANSPHDVILEVDLNGQRTSLLAHFRELNGHLAATGRDLSDIGLATAALGIADTAEVQLDSISGLHYTYDAARQAVDLQIPDSMRKPYTFDSRSLPRTAPASSSRGLVINYDAFAQTNTDEQLALYTEERYFDPAGVFSNTGIAYLYRNDQRYTRYDTSWSRSDPATLGTTQFGDTISSSLAWSRSIRIGGFQWRSNFALRPDLVTFPVPALAGSAVVPSAVDLYINNVRQFSGNVPSGPFIVSDVPGITGAGQATVITRDALGRTITTSVPLYVDTRLLAPGLSSYSFEAGFLRRAYGLESFDYDPRPAVSGSVRRGLSDSITVEGHAEATGGLYNAGAGALIRLGMGGVVNGSFSASTGRLAGTQASLGYQLIEPRFSIDAQTIRAFGNYGDLAARDGTPVPSATDQVTLALPFLRHQTFSVSYIGFRLPQGPASRTGSVSYTLNLGDLATLNLSAYRDFKQHDSRGMFLSVSFGLGHNTSVNATVGKQNGQSDYNVNAIRPPDYGGGWGWGVQAGGTGAMQYRQAQAQYLGRYGEVTAVGQNLGGRSSASLDVAGALVLMDGSAQLSRRIDDGFALVSTDGVAGIPVLHENRLIGSTDGSGHLLVPDLNAYQNNEVSIDSMKLPADARIAATSMDLVPKTQSGVLAHFGVTRYSAASVTLHGPDGKALPPGASVHHVESGKDTIVGYDGLAFIDSLQRDNRLVIDSGTLHCAVEFPYTRPSNGALPTIGPLICDPVSGDRP
ncbi:fimbria/pilus outer membrane usher protein [Paraburkholderia sp. CNPSo 3274]|uniref:fimbria/pilus outer membrane usher protein n=1 Tax=Paraburkholderia sp. CNPSo 3274 TaxID=2940932 RepID=UPI0020B716CE|nr:fimbria/pilus outer membrane usher protein [Paraburkholderia sp. CNPSo 3274]MCP3707177.1 fimbria/pilus outer membrane usher protein [Paraburkholderia sp. CNPSo 3274]